MSLTLLRFHTLSFNRCGIGDGCLYKHASEREVDLLPTNLLSTVCVELGKVAFIDPILRARGSPQTQGLT